MTRAEAIEIAADRIAWFFAEHDTPTDAATAAVDALLEAGMTFGEEAEATITGLRALVSDLTDPDECSYDHHGYCQTHTLGERPCAHERARAVLARPEFPDTEGSDGR